MKELLIDYDGDLLDIHELVPDVTDDELQEFWFLQNTDIHQFIKEKSVTDIMLDIGKHYREIVQVLYKEPLFSHITMEHFEEYLHKRYGAIIKDHIVVDKLI